MGHEAVPAQPLEKMGSLFCLDVDGKLEKHLSKIDISNGLAWSGDHKTMYYIDSLPRKVYAFDYDIDTGIPSKCISVEFYRGVYYYMYISLCGPMNTVLLYIGF